MANLREMLRQFHGDEKLEKHYLEFNALLDDSKVHLYLN
jgi:hypothetical protein